MSSLDAPGVPRHSLSSLRSVFNEAIRFVGTGCISFPVGLGITALCREVFGWPAEVAVATSIAILLVLNFVLSRMYVFKSHDSAQSQLTRFIIVALTMRGAEYLLFLFLFHVFHMPYLLSMAAALIVSLGIKFIIYRTWVFGRSGTAGTR